MKFGRGVKRSQGGNYPCLIIINNLYYTEIKIHPHNQIDFYL